MTFKVSPFKSNRQPVDITKLAAFAAGADTGVPEVPQPTLPGVSAALPWADLDNKKRRPAFSMRFTDSEQAKLKFISENTPDSMHEFCLKAIQSAIETKLSELSLRS
jgi:hypothetical protein